MDVEDKARKKEFQDLVRSLGAINAVFGALGPNHENQIRNWALQTLNCLTHNNPENQKTISDLENLGNVENNDVSVDRDKERLKKLKNI